MQKSIQRWEILDLADIADEGDRVRGIVVSLSIAGSVDQVLELCSFKRSAVGRREEGEQVDERRNDESRPKAFEPNVSESRELGAVESRGDESQRRQGEDDDHEKSVQE